MEREVLKEEREWDELNEVKNLQWEGGWKNNCVVAANKEMAIRVKWVKGHVSFEGKEGRRLSDY